MQIGKSLLILLLVMSAFSGVGVYQVLIARGWLSVSIPYEAEGYMDYTIKPQQQPTKRR